MSENRDIWGPLWAMLLGGVVAAMVVVFFLFVQSGEAAQAADEQPHASRSPMIVGGTEVPNGKYPFAVFIKVATIGGLEPPPVGGEHEGL